MDDNEAPPPKEGHKKKRKSPASSSGAERPPPQGPRARAKMALQASINQPLDALTKEHLASISQAWQKDRRASAVPAQAMEELGSSSSSSAAAPAPPLHAHPPPPPPPAPMQLAAPEPPIPSAAAASVPAPPPTLPEGLPAPSVLAPSPAAAPASTLPPPPLLPPPTSKPPSTGTQAPPQDTLPTAKVKFKPAHLPFVFMGVAPCTKYDNEHPDSLTLLAAELPPSSTHLEEGLYWALSTAVRALRLADHWHTLLGRLTTPGSGSCYSLALTNPLPGLQLLLEYYADAACGHLFAEPENTALTALTTTSWVEQTAIALLLGAGVLSEEEGKDEATQEEVEIDFVRNDGQRTRQRRTRHRKVSHRTVWALLTYLDDAFSTTAAVTSRDVLGELDKVGPVHAFALHTPPDPKKRQHLLLLHSLRDKGFLVHHKKQHEWSIHPDLVAGMARLAFLYTGGWELVGKSKDLVNLQTSYFALLGGHAMGLFASKHSLPPPRVDATGIAHLFATHKQLEQVIAAHLWHQKVDSLVSHVSQKGLEETERELLSLMDGVLDQVAQRYKPEQREQRAQNELALPALQLRPYILGVMQAEVDGWKAGVDARVQGLVSCLVYSATWQYLRGLRMCAVFFMHKLTYDLHLSIKLFELILLPKQGLPDWNSYTAGMRRDSWVALAALKKKVVAIAAKDDKARAVEDLKDMYQEALDGDVMNEVAGGFRLAFGRSLRTLKRKNRGMDVDTTPKATRGEGYELGEADFSVKFGSYADVYVEAVQAPPQGPGKRLMFNGGQNVEEVALEAYEALGWRGVFSEMRLFLMLYRLLLWEVIMDPTVPGAFPCPAQAALRLPLDMWHAHMFYLRRAQSFQDRLSKLKRLITERKLGAEVARCWDRHFYTFLCPTAGTDNRGWICSGVDKEVFVEVAVGLGQCGLLIKALERLARGFPSWVWGLPDLLVWAPMGKVKGSLPRGGKARGVKAPITVEEGTKQRRLMLKNQQEKKKEEESAAKKAKEQQGGGGGGGGQEGEGEMQCTPQDQAPAAVYATPDQAMQEEEEEEEEYNELAEEEEAREQLLREGDEPLGRDPSLGGEGAFAMLTQASDVDEEGDGGGEEGGRRVSLDSKSTYSPAYHSSLESSQQLMLVVEKEDPLIKVKLVEVKSQNDLLSDYQLAWISQFIRDEIKLIDLSQQEDEEEEGGGNEPPPSCRVFEMCHVRSVSGEGKGEKGKA